MVKDPRQRPAFSERLKKVQNSRRIDLDMILFLSLDSHAEQFECGQASRSLWGCQWRGNWGIVMSERHSTTIDISDTEILAMIESILGLLIDNPEELDLADQINKRLLTFIHYDFYHYVMDVSSQEHDDRLDIHYETWKRIENVGPEQTVLMPPSKIRGRTFEEMVDDQYQRVIERYRTDHPARQQHHYYRLASQNKPKIAIGFFRCKAARGQNAFSTDEMALLDRFAPHLFLLYRVVLNQVHLSEGFQYFNAFSRLGSKLANEHKLTETEVKLIPDLLFGYTNEEIAERHFVSIATIKSHIKHILKKTGTKNRMDFIGTFFTSPKHVQL